MKVHYVGTYDGVEYRSLYPGLYRLCFTQYIAGRSYDVDKIVTAIDEHHARSRATGDVRGGVDVWHLADLAREF